MIGTLTRSSSRRTAADRDGTPVGPARGHAAPKRGQQGHTNDWHPPPRLPSWPGTLSVPPRGRRYNCSLITVPSRRERYT